MKHWIALANVPEVDQYLAIARFAEELGFHGITVPDHLVMPAHAQTPYPYTPDGKTWWPDDLPWADPYVTLAAMGAVTTTLHLSTNIYLAALRDVFTVAKAVSTAAVLSNNRISCGVSAGWLKEEYDLLGVDFESRGKRLDEMLKALRLLWTGKETSFDGQFFQFENAIMSPAPTKAIPVWSGGGSAAALRRAAENDGWLGLPLPTKKLIATVKEINALREQLGKQDQPFDFLFTLIETPTPEAIGELYQLGARNMLSLPWAKTPWARAPWLKDGEDNASLDVKKQCMERYANKIMQKK
jgi:probable F420-dependent oxidoreductase